MKISASVQNEKGLHQVTLKTNDSEHCLRIAPKPDGFGSSANGGELLFLALATCYCNDIYREAEKCSATVERVEVEVEGDFEAEGQPAKNATDCARVEARASEAEIRSLMNETDKVAEIQNTLRVVTPVALRGIEAVAR